MREGDDLSKPRQIHRMPNFNEKDLSKLRQKFGKSRGFVYGKE